MSFVHRLDLRTEEAVERRTVLEVHEHLAHDPGAHANEEIGRERHE